MSLASRVLVLTEEVVEERVMVGLPWRAQRSA